MKTKIIILEKKEMKNIKGGDRIRPVVPPPLNP